MQVCLIYNLAQLETHAYCSTPDIVLCGNKADLEDKRQVSTERAKQFALEHGLVNVIFKARHTLYLLFPSLPYFETSAATGENVGESVNHLLDLVSFFSVFTLDLIFGGFIIGNEKNG